MRTECQGHNDHVNSPDPNKITVYSLEVHITCRGIHVSQGFLCLLGRRSVTRSLKLTGIKINLTPAILNGYLN